MGGTNKCPVCSATFTRSQHVARHMRSHTGDRPYPCPWCPEKFARSDLLARHKKKFHPDGPNSAPPPAKYSRQPKQPAAAAAGSSSAGAAAAGGSASGSTSAVAGGGIGKGKARADSMAGVDVARLSLSDAQQHAAAAAAARRASLGGPGVLPPGYPFAGPSGAAAPPAGTYTFGSLPAYDGAGLVQQQQAYPHPHLQQQQQYGLPPQQQQQQQPLFNAYDRRFSLPGGLPGSYAASGLSASYGPAANGGYPSSGGSSAASSSSPDFQPSPASLGRNSLGGTSAGAGPGSLAPAAAAYASSGLVGLSDSPVGVSPADSGSTFASGGPQAAPGGGQWFSTPYNPSYQTQPASAGPRGSRQPPSPYYPTAPPSTAAAAAAGGQTLLAGAGPGQPQTAYDLDQAAYVPHLVGGPARSPLGLGGWGSELDWPPPPTFTADSRPSTSFIPSPSSYAPKPSLNPLQAPGGGYPAPGQQQPHKIPSLEDVKDIWRYFLSPALPTPAAQPFGGIAPIGPGGPSGCGGGLALDIPGGQTRHPQQQQQQQQQPFATDEAQARSFEDAIRSRPAMQLQAPGGPPGSRRTYDGAADRGSYDYPHTLQQQQQEPPPHHQQLPQLQPQLYHSTWPPAAMAPSEARGLLSNAAAAAVSGPPPKREFSSVDFGPLRPSQHPNAAYGHYPLPSPGGGGGVQAGGRPKMPRLRSGSVGRVPEGQVWEGFLEGYRGASAGFGGGEGVLPSA